MEEAQGLAVATCMEVVTLWDGNTEADRTCSKSAMCVPGPGPLEMVKNNSQVYKGETEAQRQRGTCSVTRPCRTW